MYVTTEQMGLMKLCVQNKKYRACNSVNKFELLMTFSTCIILSGY